MQKCGNALHHLPRTHKGLQDSSHIQKAGRGGDKLGLKWMGLLWLAGSEQRRQAIALEAILMNLGLNANLLSAKKHPRWSIKN